MCVMYVCMYVRMYVRMYIYIYIYIYIHTCSIHTCTSQATIAKASRVYIYIYIYIYKRDLNAILILAPRKQRWLEGFQSLSSIYIYIYIYTHKRDLNAPLILAPRKQRWLEGFQSLEKPCSKANLSCILVLARVRLEFDMRFSIWNIARSRTAPLLCVCMYVCMYVGI
jgi:hypothetical protein